MKETRRSFLKKSAAAGFFVSAARIYGQAAGAGTQKLRVLKIGTGGMGGADIGSLSGTGKVIFTGLCDTDPNTLRHACERFKGAPGSTDFRELLSKYANTFDAVCVSTPDHTHAVAALEAMRLGKHVYVQKPLAHSYQECEALLAAARKYKVVTQMGNQGHPGVYRYEKLWEKKFWGDILAVHSWTDRAGGRWWPQGMQSLPKAEKIPEGYNWDCWLGPAATRSYSGAYLPGRWRGWKDFGCGAIGDMAVHNLDPAYWLLADCQLPVRIKSWADEKCTYAYPRLSKVDFRFAPTARCPKGFNLFWYESGILPTPPPGAHLAQSMPDNGLMVVGTRATTMGGSHAGTPTCIAATGKPFGSETKSLQREGSQMLKPADGTRARWQYGHYDEWVDACLANDPSRPGSRFEYAVPLTETLIFGCIAQFLPGEELVWDPAKKTFNNAAATAMLTNPARAGFEIRV